ncbi:MAG: hypothetical protein U9Q15_00965 [Patescibacteria group bacterium]|nr:hypothetical protein [Patescibacteria group bacterium]
MSAMATEYELEYSGADMNKNWTDTKNREVHFEKIALDSTKTDGSVYIEMKYIYIGKEVTDGMWLSFYDADTDEKIATAYRGSGVTKHLEISKENIDDLSNGRFYIKNLVDGAPSPYKSSIVTISVTEKASVPYVVKTFLEPNPAAVEGGKNYTFSFKVELSDGTYKYISSYDNEYGKAWTKVASNSVVTSAETKSEYERITFWNKVSTVEVSSQVTKTVYAYFENKNGETVSSFGSSSLTVKEKPATQTGLSCSATKTTLDNDESTTISCSKTMDDGTTESAPEFIVSSYSTSYLNQSGATFTADYSGVNNVTATINFSDNGFTDSLSLTINSTPLPDPVEDEVVVTWSDDSMSFSVVQTWTEGKADTVIPYNDLTVTYDTSKLSYDDNGQFTTTYSEFGDTTDAVSISYGGEVISTKTITVTGEDLADISLVHPYSKNYLGFSTVIIAKGHVGQEVEVRKVSDDTLIDTQTVSDDGYVTFGGLDLAISEGLKLQYADQEGNVLANTNDSIAQTEVESYTLASTFASGNPILVSSGGTLASSEDIDDAINTIDEIFYSSQDYNRILMLKILSMQLWEEVVVGTIDQVSVMMSYATNGAKMKGVSIFLDADLEVLSPAARDKNNLIHNQVVSALDKLGTSIGIPLSYDSYLENAQVHTEKEYKIASVLSFIGQLVGAPPSQKVSKVVDTVEETLPLVKKGAEVFVEETEDIIQQTVNLEDNVISSIDNILDDINKEKIQNFTSKQFVNKKTELTEAFRKRSKEGLSGEHLLQMQTARQYTKVMLYLEMSKQPMLKKYMEQLGYIKNDIIQDSADEILDVFGRSNLRQKDVVNPPDFGNAVSFAKSENMKNLVGMSRVDISTTNRLTRTDMCGTNDPGFGKVFQSEDFSDDLTRVQQEQLLYDKTKSISDMFTSPMSFQGTLGLETHKKSSRFLTTMNYRGQKIVVETMFDNVNNRIISLDRNGKPVFYQENFDETMFEAMFVSQKTQLNKGGKKGFDTGEDVTLTNTQVGFEGFYQIDGYSAWNSIIPDAASKILYKGQYITFVEFAEIATTVYGVDVFDETFAFADDNHNGISNIQDIINSVAYYLDVETIKTGTVLASASYSQTIGSSEDIVGKARITLNPGAIQNDTQISINQVHDTIETNDGSIIRAMVDIGPDGTQFSEGNEATIELEYNGDTTGDVVIHTMDKTTKTLASLNTTYVGDGKYQAKTATLSPFFLVELPPSAPVEEDDNTTTEETPVEEETEEVVSDESSSESESDTIIDDSTEESEETVDSESESDTVVADQEELVQEEEQVLVELLSGTICDANITEKSEDIILADICLGSYAISKILGKNEISLRLGKDVSNTLSPGDYVSITTNLPDTPVVKYYKMEMENDENQTYHLVDHNVTQNIFHLKDPKTDVFILFTGLDTFTVESAEITIEKYAGVLEEDILIDMPNIPDSVSEENIPDLIEEKSMEIKHGWNLINPNFTGSPEDMMNNIESYSYGVADTVFFVYRTNDLGQVQWLFWSNNETYTTAMLEAGYNQIETIQYGEALWVKNISGGSWDYQYNYQPNSKLETTIKPGWNFVSFNKNITNQEFDDLKELATILWIYDTDSQTWKTASKYWDLETENLDYELISEILHTQGVWIKGDIPADTIFTYAPLSSLALLGLIGLRRKQGQVSAAKTLVIAIPLIFLLSACGGGSGNSQSPSMNANVPAAIGDLPPVLHSYAPPQ